MKVLAVIILCYAVLFLLVGIAGAIAGALAGMQERRARRRLSWCPSCHEPMQGGVCANCRDIPAGWLTSARQIQDEDPMEGSPLPAWKGVERREREEARERTILDRRAQEHRQAAPQRTEGPEDREWAARTLWASVGAYREVQGS